MYNSEKQTVVLTKGRLLSCAAAFCYTSATHNASADVIDRVTKAGEELRGAFRLCRK